MEDRNERQEGRKSFPCGRLPLVKTCGLWFLLVAILAGLTAPRSLSANYLAGFSGADPMQSAALASNTVYNCSTALQFDRFMSLVPAGTASSRTVVNLAAGVFRTRGGNGTGAPL